MSRPLLSIRKCNVTFGSVRAADDATLDIPEGKTVAVIGPNGSGKTTLLNLCTGYIRPASGEIMFDGENLVGTSPRAIVRRGVGRAFQIPQLFTDHTILENVALAVAARGGRFWTPLRPLLTAETREAAEEVLAMFGLGDAMHAPAADLSEGQRKLVDIAIAMALKPRLLFLDEPTAGISSGEKLGFMDRLTALLRGQAVTVVFVEHDMDLVARYADRVAVWSGGRVMVEGEPEEVLAHPEVLRDVVGVI